MKKGSLFSPSRRYSVATSMIVSALLLTIIAGSVFLVRNNQVHAASTTVQHYEYVFPDGAMYVYDMDNNFALVKQVSLPTTNVRGVSVSAATSMLYVSYNGDGGGHGNGSLLKYNLLTDQVVWSQNYNFGIDSMDITPDGKTIYMPDGEAAYDGYWHILDAGTGAVTGSIFIGQGGAAHNTLVSLDGKYVYLAALNYNYLVQVDTSTNQITKLIGPTVSGVRPFTFTSDQHYAFTTDSGFIGFDVSDITTGKVLYTVAPPGFTAPAGLNAPSHGITLSPDEKMVYFIDSYYQYVHVYDVSGLPTTAPTHVTDIKLVQPLSGTVSPCGYDCNREGWINISRDGRFLFVGDSGDVISTATNKQVAELPSLNNSRKNLEVDWANGSILLATPREGMGYKNYPIPTPGSTPTPTSTSTPTATSTPTTTPVAGTVVAQDSFQRANQTYWGTASDGHSWSGDANTNTNFSIANNAGVISGNGAANNAVLGPVGTDEEVLTTGSLSSFTNNNFGAVIRWSDTNNWYKAYIDGAQLILQARVAGTYSTLSSVAYTATAGTSYTLRFRVSGSNLYAKAWPAGSTEPTNWAVTATSTALSSGYGGLRIQVATGASANVTSFLETVPGTVTPTPTPTASATATPTATSTVTPTPTSTPISTVTPTPLPGAVIAQDTFHRANQTYWGTASDGQMWGGDANNNVAFSIVNNAGHISGGSTPFNAVLGPTAANEGVLFSGTLSSFTNTNLGAVVRWTDANNWYKAYINGTSLVIQKKVNGTVTTLGSASFAAVAGTSYTLRFNVVGNTLTAKAWQAGSTEPSAWMVSVNDSSFASGYCGIRIQLQSGITADVTSFQGTQL